MHLRYTARACRDIDNLYVYCQHDQNRDINNDSTPGAHRSVLAAARDNLNIISAVTLTGGSGGWRGGGGGGGAGGAEGKSPHFIFY